MKTLGALTPEERRTQGQHLNELRVLVTEAFERRKEILDNQALDKRLAIEKIDVTLPRSEQHTSERHRLLRIAHAAVCLKSKIDREQNCTPITHSHVY